MKENVVFDNTCFFNLGDEVFVVCGPNQISKGKIVAFNSLTFKKELETTVVPMSARLDIYPVSSYFDFDLNAVPFYHLTKSEEEAQNWAKIHNVVCSEKEWQKLLYDSVDEYPSCELEQCCDDIANIRDMLFKCRKNGYLIGWEVNLLNNMINNSCHEKPQNSIVIDNVLNQLNIKWK